MVQSGDCTPKTFMIYCIFSMRNAFLRPQEGGGGLFVQQVSGRSYHPIELRFGGHVAR